MEQLTIDGSFKEHEFKNCNLYAPIEYWNSNDVWNHIYNHRLDWVNANELGRIYAEAANDGDECKSLLEGFETGLTPGCGKSARYGCWVCLLFEKDKTLNNLTHHYDYLKYMEDFRNWLAQFRYAEWNDNRDIFIHGKHRMKKYDMNNHRKGMQIPGGYNLNFRKQVLIRLLETEEKVISERKIPLITDEELAYIQEIWIEDGDLELSVLKIAKNRKFKHLINPMYFKVLKSVEQMKDYSKPHPYHIVNYTWKWIYDLDNKLAFDTSKFCERYFCQMAIQLERNNFDSFNIMKTLIDNNYKFSRYLAIKLIKKLPLETKMHFVDKAKENYIREEWKEDKIGFLTFLGMFYQGEIKIPKEKNLFGFNSEYYEHFEALKEFKKKEDIILCEKISLKDKMRYFDNW